MPSIVAHNVTNMFAAHHILSHREQSAKNQNIKDQTKTPEAVEALKTQKDKDLHNLHHSFFDTAQNAPISPDAKTMAHAFSALSPKEALLLAQALYKTYGYSDNVQSHVTIDENLNDYHSGPENAPKTPLYPHIPTSSKQRDTLASLNMAKHQQNRVAENSLKQIQNQTQNFITNMLGGSLSSSDIREALGENACFEDVLMYVLMKIAKQEERNVTEKIRTIERGHAGLPGFLSNRARDLGGVAGGAIGAGIGAYFSGAAGGTTGATIGQDIGERLVGSYTGNNSPESRQMQFEKLKHMMQKLSEMTTCISNILTTMHQTNKNTLGNIRG